MLALFGSEAQSRKMCQGKAMVSSLMYCEISYLQGDSAFSTLLPTSCLQFNICLADLKEEIEKASRKVQSIADSFPISDHTRAMNDALVKAENSSRPYFKEAKHYEKYR